MFLQKNKKLLRNVLGKKGQNLRNFKTIWVLKFLIKIRLSYSLTLTPHLGWLYFVGEGFPARNGATFKGGVSLSECIEWCEDLRSVDPTYNGLEHTYDNNCWCFINSRGFTARTGLMTYRWH